MSPGIIERQLQRERKARADAERVAFEALERLARQRDALREQATALADALSISRETARDRSTLVNSAAHVLRTPMTTLLLRLHTVRRQAGENAEAAVDSALEAAQQLNSVVNDLIRSAQVDIGGLVAEIHPFSIMNVLAEADGFVSGRIDCNDCVAVGDPGRLVEVLGIIGRATDHAHDLPVHVASGADAVVLSVEVPAPAASREEREELGLGEHLIRSLCTSMGVVASFEDDAVGTRHWHLAIPVA